MSDVPARLVACSRHATSDIRLKCFDDVAAAVQELTRAASARNQFAWSKHESGTGPERKITIAIASSDAIVSSDATSQKNSFFLAASCAAGQLNFYLAFPDKAYGTTMDAVIRRGDDRSKVALQPSESGRAMGLWSDGPAREMLSSLTFVGNVSIEFPDTLMPVTLYFDVKGLENEMKPLLAACPR